MFRKRQATQRRSPAGDPDPGQTFRVRLQSSGKTLSVSADQSILEAMESQRIPVAYFCRNGVCGTCEYLVISGEVIHQDGYLTDDARANGNRILICVSRAAPGTTLVLDA
ncbi:2Fe-2S iron-sulfur cluster-binding protein [Mycolicibacter minnesotensis]